MSATETLQDRLGALFASDPNAMADPWPVWRELRETAPVVQLGAIYLVTRHGDVKAVFRDAERFSSDSYRRGSYSEKVRATLTAEQRRAFDDIFEFQALMVVSTDEPEHTRLRRIAHRAFTPRRIWQLEEAAALYVDQIVDRLAAQDGVVDLMELAYSVPLMIIGDLLGVPEDDRARIKEWSDVWAENMVATDDRLLLGARASNEFRAYVEGMIEDHRRSPDASDLVSVLVGAEQEERLTADELAAMFFVLLFGGHETTTNLIANGMLDLLRRPDQWRLLCSDPEGLAAPAVEELLRYETPVQYLTRVALADVEIDGCEIPAGGSVYLVAASANRDPDIFRDPETLDLLRDDVTQQLALGFGSHFCLGASLARLEAAIVLRTLAARFPGMELASDDLEWCGRMQLRSLKSLPVTLS
jgi:cytochrome P450